MLLEYAVRKMRNMPSSEDAGQNEKKYLESLVCYNHSSGSEIRLNLVQSILWSIGLWCDNKLLDYHWHFRQVVFCTNILLVFFHQCDVWLVNGGLTCKILYLMRISSICQKPSLFKGVLSMALAVGNQKFDASGNMEVFGTNLFLLSAFSGSRNKVTMDNILLGN